MKSLALCCSCGAVFEASDGPELQCPHCGWRIDSAAYRALLSAAQEAVKFGWQYRRRYEADVAEYGRIERYYCLAECEEALQFAALAAASGVIGGLAYDYIAPRKYLEVQYVAGYILPKDATEDHPATLPADMEAIVWYMIAQQWAIIENDAAGLSAFSISDVSWTFDKNISETWQSVISKYQRW